MLIVIGGMEPVVGGGKSERQTRADRFFLFLLPSHGLMFRRATIHTEADWLTFSHTNLRFDLIFSLHKLGMCLPAAAASDIFCHTRT